MPDLYHQFAGDSGHGEVAFSFSSEELPAPLAQRGAPAGPQHGLGPLDEEVTQVATASFATDGTAG
jgi:hypothetical protein